MGARIAAGMIGGVVLTAALGVGLSDRAFSNLGDQISERETAWLAEIARLMVDGQSEKAHALASSVVAVPGVHEAMRAGNRDAVLALMPPVQYNLRASGVPVEQFQFHLAPATSFLRVHQPARHGDDLSSFRATVVEANRARRAVMGLEGGVAGLGFRGVVPVADSAGHMGTVEFGLSLGEPFLREFRTRFGVHAALYAEGRSGFARLATTTDTLPVVASDALALDAARGQVETWDGAPHLLVVIPLRDFSGGP